jgi:aspartate-semialdehyde dehydrogenase
VSTVAIVHPTGLLAKEIRETLERRGAGRPEIRLLSSREDEIGSLTEVAGAAAIVQRFAAEGLERVETAFFCGPIAANRPLLADLPAAVTAVVLSTDATVDDGAAAVAGVSVPRPAPGRPLLSPHPAVVLLAHLLAPLRAYAPEQAVATLVQPASLADDPGLEELFEQTRRIVAMSGRPPKTVFGAQLAFNLLPAATAAEPVVRQLDAVLAGPPVSLQLLQGGVFHGLAASLYFRLAAGPSLPAVRKALAQSPYLAVADQPRHLGPIDAAAQDKILLGALRQDQAGGFWIWAVMDNLTRGGASNALEIAGA